MKSLAFINAINLTMYAREVLPNGANALQAVITYSQQLPDITEIIFLTTAELELAAFAGKLPLAQLTKPAWSLPELLTAMAEAAARNGSGQIFYFYADCPLLNQGLTARMYRNHIQYFADYTFADGYPYGLAPEIFKKELLTTLLQQPAGSQESQGTPKGRETAAVKRDSLFELIKKDINNYDLETEISPVDLRLLRLALTTDTKRNYLLVKRLLELEPAGWAAQDVKNLLAAIQANQPLLRTLPAFFNIQIVAGCLQNCTYCPYPAERGESLGKTGEMSPEQFETILAEIKALTTDAVISLSLWGEPALHSRIYELIHTVLATEACELLIETSGLGWQEAGLQRLKEEMEQGSISRAVSWIVSLDAHSEQVYTSLRGEGFAEAREFTDTLLKLFAPEQVYVQAVRMKDNEEDLEPFYRYWKGRQLPFIIQKYDDFCGRLPDRQVTDLSPLKRFPCWHLKRDVHILLDGDVPMCREDLARTHLLGNIFTDGLAKIWARGESWYLEQLAGRYPAICEQCDEYYTYNY